MLLFEGSLETTLFRHLSNHGFPSPSFQKYISFFLKASKSLKNGEKNWEIVFLFRDDCMWNGWVKLSLLIRQYLWHAVDVLKTVLRFCLSLRESFLNLMPFTVIYKYGKSGVIQISALFIPFNILLVEGSSKTRLFKNLSNNVFRNS